MRPGLLDLRLHDILHLLDGKRTVVGGGELLDLLGDAINAGLRQLVRRLDRIVGLADRIGDLVAVKRPLLSATLDYVHLKAPFFTLCGTQACVQSLGLPLKISKRTSICKAQKQKDINILCPDKAHNTR